MLDREPGGCAVPPFKWGSQGKYVGTEIPRSTLRKRAVYWPVFRKDVPMAMNILGIFDLPPATAPRGLRDASPGPGTCISMHDSRLRQGCIELTTPA
ncbi:MAG: hypothetical protein AAGH89_16500 [Verrucomicrobiota bacterium]